MKDPRDQQPGAMGELSRLRWGVVANAGRLSSERTWRWSHVRRATGLGSTRAQELCVAAGFDPDEEVGGDDQQQPDDDDGGFPDDFARFNSVSIAFSRAVGLLKEINMPCICHLTKPETCWTCRRNAFLAAQQQPSPTAGPRATCPCPRRASKAERCALASNLTGPCSCPCHPATPPPSTGELVRREDVVEQVARWLMAGQERLIALMLMSCPREGRCDTSGAFSCFSCWLRDLAPLDSPAPDAVTAKRLAPCGHVAYRDSDSDCIEDGCERAAYQVVAAPDAGQTTKGTP